MQANRNPIETYEQAVLRLVSYRVSERHTEEALKLALQIVADLFWVSDAKVGHDVRREEKKLPLVPAPRPRFLGVNHGSA